MVFDRGSYEFTRDNDEKDLVIGYRSTDKDGNVQYDTFAVRADDPAKPTRLALIGNQNDYDGSVAAYHQLRDFPNIRAHNYYSTGYAFNIPKVGNLQKVVVTSPKNKTLILIAGTGLNILTFPKHDQSGASGASFIRLRSVYADRWQQRRSGQRRHQPVLCRHTAPATPRSPPIRRKAPGNSTTTPASTSTTSRWRRPSTTRRGRGH